MPVFRKIALHLSLFLFINLSAFAEPSTPDGATFHKLLSGNSLVGIWEDERYQQYFASDGSTTYLALERPPAKGTWKINQAGQFCSTWPGIPTAIETCYRATQEGKKIYWENKKGKLFASTLIPGNILLKGDEQPVVDMSQQEFIDFIAGNSLKGMWGSAQYQQYFAKHGQTSYQESRNRPSEGRWRINEAGKYCSTWPPSPTEVCYKAQRQGAQLMWHTSQGEVFPATLFEGNVLLDKRR